jgi:hypothetical protein
MAALLIGYEAGMHRVNEEIPYYRLPFFGADHLGSSLNFM